MQLALADAFLSMMFSDAFEEEEGIAILLGQKLIWPG